jgi:hypothetical protein
MRSCCTWSARSASFQNADLFTQLQHLELPSPDQPTQQSEKLLDLVQRHPSTILAKHIFENDLLYGEVIRLDGAIRLAPR